MILRAFGFIGVVMMSSVGVSQTPRTLTDINFGVAAPTFLTNGGKTINFDVTKNLGDKYKPAFKEGPITRIEYFNESESKIDSITDTLQSEVKGQDQTIYTLDSTVRYDEPSANYHNARVWQLRNGKLEGYTECIDASNNFNVNTDFIRKNYCFSISPSGCGRLLDQMSRTMKKTSLEEIQKCQEIAGRTNLLSTYLEPDDESIESINKLKQFSKNHIQFDKKAASLKPGSAMSFLEVVFKARERCEHFTQLWKNQGLLSKPSAQGKPQTTDRQTN